VVVLILHSVLQPDLLFKLFRAHFATIQKES
jgi:hypothetical protein